MSAPLLEVSDLEISATGPLVHGVGFRVDAGEAVGIVGESGSGKSLTLRAVIDLLPRGVRVTGGEVALNGRAAMVFQDPLAALDPLMSIGAQLWEVCRTAGGLDRAAALARSHELLRIVHLPDPERRWKHLPGQLSGGQRQRVVLAIALATNPQILLCDEPTTALDVTVQRQILDLLAELRRELSVAILFVSHDLAVVADVCSRVIVMSAGRVVEEGSVAQILSAPRHPYTKMLLGAVLPIPPMDAVAALAAPGELS